MRLLKAGRGRPRLEERRDLEQAGFERIEEQRRERLLRFTRDRALAMLRARFASSFALIPNEEFEAGLSRAEREMPEAFTSVLRIGVLVAGSTSAFVRRESVRPRELP